MILNFLGFLHFSFIDVLDIIVVATIVYFLFRWMKGSSAINIFLAIILLVAIRIIAEVAGMKMLSTLMGTVLDIGAVALVVIFQPEIRQFLSRVGKGAGLGGNGRSLLDRILKREDSVLEEDHIRNIAEACRDMADEKTGALIVMLHKDSLQPIIETGDVIDAEIKSRLIKNIFFKNSPLHDGAMVIGRGRIVAARCTLPITERTDIPANYGMRHKAAIGISEISDADVIVVSEQTGSISFVKDGVITPVTGKNNLKLILGGSGQGDD